MGRAWTLCPPSSLPRCRHLCNCILCSTLYDKPVNGNSVFSGVLCVEPRAGAVGLLVHSWPVRSTGQQPGACSWYLKWGSAVLGTVPSALGSDTGARQVVSEQNRKGGPAGVSGCRTAACCWGESLQLPGHTSPWGRLWCDSGGKQWFVFTHHSKRLSH